MRTLRFLKNLMFLATLPLVAQVESQLKTVTDLSDVYKQVAAKSKVFCLFDFTPTSRAIFEPYDYLATGGRLGYLGLENNGQFASANFDSGNNGIAATFNPPTGIKGKATGIAMGLRMNGTTPEVRLYWWPQHQLSNTQLDPIKDLKANTVRVGTPMRTKSDGTVEAIPADASLTKAKVIAQTTHVRFTFRTSGNVDRTIDLPCPWRVWDSPAVSTGVDISATASNYQRSTYSVTKSDGTTVSGLLYDPWSQQLESTVTTTVYTYPAGLLTSGDINIPSNDTELAEAGCHWTNGTVGRAASGGPDTVMGQFVYTADYLGYVFGGKSRRLVDATDGKVDWTTAGLAGTTWSVPDASSKPGWQNGLPAMSRYQAMKYTVIQGYLNNSAAMNLYYRFLDPNYSDSGNTGNHEETKGVSDTTFGGSDYDFSQAIYPSKSNRQLKLLSRDKLALSSFDGTTTSNNDMLRWRGPDNYTFDVSQAFTLYDSGSPDPNIPQPINYGAANLYRQISESDYPAISGEVDSACAGAYVLIFPGQAMNDSYATPKTSDAAAVPVAGNAGGNGNGGGSFSTTNNSASLDPDQKGFFGAVTSSIAAFGSGSADAARWNAPFNLTIAGNSVKIQTMVISVGVPGAYHFKNTNAGAKSPHENLFLMAQWADPARTNWSKRNGQPADQDLPVQLASKVGSSYVSKCQVFYWTGSDPTELAEAVNDAFGRIVAAGAALSAPATPATGVRSANQAYFGIFVTSLDPLAKIQQYPLWSGNLYSMGIKRSTEFIDPLDEAKGTHEVFSFYGYNATGTNNTTPTDPSTGLPSFDYAHLWSSYDIFGSYYNAISGSTTVHTSGRLKGSTQLWHERKMYTMVGGVKKLWPNESSPGSASTSSSDPDSILTQLANTVYNWDVAAKTQLTTKITTAQARLFAAWLRGAALSGSTTELQNSNNLTKNRQDIMGDIVNSAPLAIDLTPSGSDALIPTGYSNPFTAAKYSDHHARLIVVGTNTGQLECFFEWTARYDSGIKDAAGQVVYLTDAQAVELWSFVPPDFWQALYNLYMSKTTADITHLYMVDGDPVLYHIDKAPSDTTKGYLPDTRVSKNEDALVAWGHRKGARSYYGLKLSSSSVSTIKPDAFTIGWYVNPNNPTSSAATAPTLEPTAPMFPSSPGYSDATEIAVIKTMGMSTSVPSIATVNTGSAGAVGSTSPNKFDILLLGGGYSNPEVDARFKALDSTTYANGMGRLILALDPLTGTLKKYWDLRTKTGAIAEGVTPVRIFNNSELAQRLYFADMSGNVWAINNGQATVGSTTAATGYRLDSAILSDWITTPRAIYKASSNLDSASAPYVMRFTTRPDAFSVSGGFPIPNSDDINPITVMVAIGTSDRNNPTDKDETYSILKYGTTNQWWNASTSAYVTSASAISNTQYPPSTNRFFVFADRQDSASSSLGFDSSGIPDNSLQSIKYDGSDWTTTYDDKRVIPSTTESTYLFNDRFGYYINLGTGSLSANTWNGGVTYDKIMVSPLIKQGLLFFSIFNIYNGAGFNCSSNAFTRTFRQCDILRPLALDTQTTDLSEAADIQGSLKRTSDSCSGLAFFFNSLSSQLVDAGDRVVQGGALSASASDTEINASQSAQNKPAIKNVKDSDSVQGIRVRAWRVVR